MSTRRARIKAVAALPPRRKNAEAADPSKNKPPAKETSEKGLKSPRTPRSLAKSDEKNSPGLKSPPPISPKPDVLSPRIESITKSPKSLGKVSVITGSNNVFASPHALSPSRRLREFSFSPKTIVDGDVAHSLNEATTTSPNSIKGDKTQHSKRNESAEQHDENEKPVESQLHSDVDGDETQKKSDANERQSSNIEKAITDDYNVRSVADSIADETAMDGVMRLRASSAPNHIDLLKNELISEYADALFDPIVPLPSPSKVRPKLRPVPRLAPHRRNSVQGSASESEDESRRALLSSGAPTPGPPRQRHDSHTSHSTQPAAPRETSRVRNDSVCSTLSQATVPPPPATSPVKDKLTKARRQEMGKRMWRRRRDTVRRDGLTMYDLIFYNPMTNPIVADQDEIKAKEENAKDEAERMAKKQESDEEADDPPPPDAAPVPQIKLGPNGEIMLDESSLVIKQSDGNRKVSSVVREGAWGGTSGRYTRTPRTADWSAAETVRFYRALGAVGTDFTLMAQLFPTRNRRELKSKFKKEERLNGAQVDKALRSATAWDVARLQDDFDQERAEAAKRAELEQKQLAEQKKAERDRVKAARDLRLRPSRAAKAIEFNIDRRGTTTELTADDFVQRAMETRAASQKRLPNRTPKVIPPLPLPKLIPSESPKNPHFATLTLVGKNSSGHENQSTAEGMATISKVDSKSILNSMPSVPANIENGSLVVLRVNDPKSPSKTMLQTYIAHGAGKLTPVALPATFLNSVVGYMKQGPQKSTMPPSSPLPLVMSPAIQGSDSRSCTPSVIQVNPSPTKRVRHSSYTITSL